MIHPGESARRLLSDPAFELALRDMRADIKDEFARAPIDAVSIMQRLRLQLQCVDAIEQKLRAYVYDLDQQQPKEGQQ